VLARSLEPAEVLRWGDDRDRIYPYFGKRIAISKVSSHIYKPIQYRRIFITGASLSTTRVNNRLMQMTELDTEDRDDSSQ